MSIENNQFQELSTEEMLNTNGGALGVVVGGILF